MRRLWRYLLKEVAYPFGVWLAFSFLLLFTMQFLRGADVLLGSAVHAIDLARLIVFLTPHFLVMAIPIAFLLGILLGLGRLGEDRELLALSALGVGPWQVAVVPVALGACLGVLVLVLGFTGVPWGLRMVRSAASDLIKKNVAEDVKAGVFYEDLTQLTLYAEEINRSEGHWTNVLIHDDRDPSAPLLVLAHEGRLIPAPGEGLKLALADGHIHRAAQAYSDYTVVAFERGELNVGLEETLFRKGRGFRSAQEELTSGELLEAAREAKASGQSAAPMLMAFHWRWAQALAPIAFALWATPLALAARRSARGWAFLLTLSGYIAYYAMWRLCESAALREDFPAILVAEIPNVVFAALGLLLLRRAGHGRIFA